MDLFGETWEEVAISDRPRDDDSWIPSLTQRLKTLLLTSPMHRLQAARNQYGEDLAAFDLRAAALRVLDAAIENMGLGSGASRVAIIGAMEPILRRSEPNATAERVRSVGSRIIDAMLNDREQRSEFEEPYLDLQQQGLSWLAFKFRLIREEELADGSIVIRATTQGINLYLGMLEFDVQSAQIASEAVLHEQIRRGRIEKAVATAQQARYRSIQFEEQIRETLRAVQRDVSQVDWAREVLPILAEARDHIQERLAAEGELIEIVSARMDEASAADAPHLVRLLDTIRDCQQRHLRLNEQLIPANATFLDEQARQGFRTLIHAPLANAESEILKPALSISAGALNRRVDSILWPLHAPSPPVPLDLAQLIQRLLAPRRETADVEYDLGKPDLEDVSIPVEPFEEADFAAVDALLASSVSVQGVRLSWLLEKSRENRLSRSVEDCLVLTVMRGYDLGGDRFELDRGHSRAMIRSDATGDLLHDSRYYGDELLVTRGTEK
jgi:hypothetical protein